MRGTRQAPALAFAHVHQPARRMAQATGLLDKIGPDQVFATLADAVRWAARRGATAPAPD